MTREAGLAIGPALFVVGAGAMIGFAACNEGAPVAAPPTQSEEARSIRAALEGRPDERTVAAMRALYSELSVPERLYLEHLSWRTVTLATAEADPVIRRALGILAGGSPALAPAPDAGSLGSRVVRPNLHVRPAVGGATTNALYDEAVMEMEQCYGKASCNNPACPAAVLAAHLEVYGPIGSPPVAPGYADKGAWQCTIDFGGGVEGRDAGTSCDLRGFCSRSEIEFPSPGQSCKTPGCYRCNDPGWSPGPNVGGCKAPVGSTSSTSSTGGGPTDPNNRCFVGDGVKVAPKDFVETCQYLVDRNPGKGGLTPMTCLDADPSHGIGSPQLPSGSDPRVDCIVQTNADFAAANNGAEENGCSHDVPGVNVTCYCCPP